MCLKLHFDRCVQSAWYRHRHQFTTQFMVFPPWLLHTNSPLSSCPPPHPPLLLYCRAVLLCYENPRFLSTRIHHLVRGSCPLFSSTVTAMLSSSAWHRYRHQFAAAQLPRYYAMKFLASKFLSTLTHHSGLPSFSRCDRQQPHGTAINHYQPLRYEILSPLVNTDSPPRNPLPPANTDSLLSPWSHPSFLTLTINRDIHAAVLLSTTPTLHSDHASGSESSHVIRC